MSKHFQKVHSDETVAMVVQFARTNPDLSKAAIGRMLREGRFPGIEGPYYVIDRTVRDWCKDADERDDPGSTQYDQMQRLARDTFELCESELAQIKQEAKPLKKGEDRKRVPADPARLKHLLATAQSAWAIIAPAIPDPEEGEEGPEKPPEPPTDPEAVKVLDAFK